MKRLAPFLYTLSVVLALMALSVRLNTKVIHPNSPQVRSETFDDRLYSETPHSEVTSFTKSPRGFELRYKTGSGRQFPYSGVVLDAVDGDWDLSRFDEVVVHFGEGVSNDFTMQMVSIVPGISDSAMPNTWRPYERFIAMGSETKKVISLDKWETPAWWFATYKVSPQQLPAQELTHIRRLLFQNGETTPVGIEQTLFIESIEFRRAPWKATLLLIVSLLLGVGGSALTGARKTMAFEYQQRDLTNVSDEESQLLFGFLGSEYFRSDLTIGRVSGATGIGEKRIREILKREKNTTLREYLTTIRMTEAARLLRESDRSIADIALHTGYKHGSTFSRHFQDHYHLSPSEFRNNG